MTPCYWKFGVAVSWPCKISSSCALKWGNRTASQWKVSMLQILLFSKDRSLILFLEKDWSWMVFTKKWEGSDQPKEDTWMENWRWIWSNTGKLQVTENNIVTARWRSWPQLSTDNNCRLKYTNIPQNGMVFHMRCLFHWCFRVKKVPLAFLDWKGIKEKK